VIAGTWRGRRLAVPQGVALRPTSDLVKSALFSILGPRVSAATVVDLCCGAGCLGIEALSRGAARARFVDLSRVALAAARGNLDVCGAAPETFRLERCDALAWLARSTVSAGDAPLVVLADPPYAGDLAARLLVALGEAAARLPLAAAVVEHATALSLPAAVTEGALGWHQHRYGDTTLTILEV
jgi:16S rRNA (guanine(966)-N(2))-methyltransferase RsmD